MKVSDIYEAYLNEIEDLRKQIERLQKDNGHMIKRCNYFEKENAMLNYQRDMFRHGLVEISALSEKQLNDGAPWDIARYYIQESNKEYNGVDTFSDVLLKKVKRLQEQLDEANEVIKDYDAFKAELTNEGKYVCNVANSAHLYLKKWGVK